MAFRDLQAGIGFALVGLQVRVDQFDETVEVLDRDGFVALIEIVHVSVEDLDEEFNGYGSVHASVGDAESALETFKNALAIAVELYRLVQSGFSVVRSIAKKKKKKGMEKRLTFLGSSSLWASSTSHHRWLARYTARH